MELVFDLRPTARVFERRQRIRIGVTGAGG
jgi:hypothetical protein